MAEQENTATGSEAHNGHQAGIEVHTGAHAEGHAAPDPMAVDVSMVLWTWATFALMALVLYKYAFKPILSALDKRESDIRDSVENADQIKAEMERLGETEKKIIGEADDQAKSIVTDARKAAQEAAQVIEAKAKEEAQIVQENAQRDILAAQEKAQSNLKRQSAEMAVGLARKVLKEKLNAEQDAQLVNRLVGEV